MEGPLPGRPPRVALLFTRFPVATETFLQREVKALRALGFACDVLALWPPPRQIPQEAAPDHTFSPWRLLTLFWRLPARVLRQPRALWRLATALAEARVPNATNFLETLLGLGYAITRARELQGRYDHLHAVWASAPATAAWALRQLTGIPYSMAGHAYDLFEHGGDGLLRTKIPEAAFIRTSTLVGRDRWLALGARPGQLRVIRRGLPELPPLLPDRRPEPPFRLLAVGRMVEKMGYPVLLELLVQLRRHGLPFTATLAGGGPLLQPLAGRAAELGLAGQVTFTGPLPYAQIEMLYRQADLFLFCGQVARSGDRPGFPNAIGEAMAWGVPVCATPVGAVTEGIVDGRTGILLTRPEQAARAIRELLQSPDRHAAMRAAARQWVGGNFDAAANMRALVEAIRAAHAPAALTAGTAPRASGR